MRRSIFKEEIEYFIVLHKLEDNRRNNLLKCLFYDHLSISKQYLLKSEHNTPEKLGVAIKSIICDDKEEKIVGDIKSLFEAKNDLELPSVLKSQLKKEKMALFVGSGVSKLLGIPLWDELAKSAIEYLHKLGKITFDEAQKVICDKVSPRQKLSIFHHVLSSEIGLLKWFYKEQFESIPNKNEKLKTRNPYDLLVKLDWPKFSINLDNQFFEALKRKNQIGELSIKSKQQLVTLSDQAERLPRHICVDFKKETDIINNAIYQIHGSFTSFDKYSIITMKDYLFNYYNKNNPGVIEFLKKIFSEYAIIFLGVGFEEFELLQNIVQSKKSHHVLIATYLNDSNLLRIKKEYYRNTFENINVHGYYLDFNGYDRLYDVIESWIRKIDFELNGQFYNKTGEFADVEF